MDALEKIYAEKQGIHFAGVPDMERDIMAWHKLVNKHTVLVDENYCAESFACCDKSDGMSLRQVCNASAGGELQVKMNYYASDTGRSTTTGVNIQGLKKGSAGRRAIISRPGRVFIKIDSSSIEPRCLALVAREKELLDKIKAGVDIYEDFGRSVGLDRACGKIAFLASMYGQGVKGIIRLFESFGKKISVDEATRIRYGFIKKYGNITGGLKNGVGLWQDSLGRVIADSALKLPSGRYINFKPLFKGRGAYGTPEYENIGPGGHHEHLWFGRTVNNLIQGTARDVFFLQVSNMVKALDGLADICWTVHDDALFECNACDVDKVKDVLIACASETPDWLPPGRWFRGKVSVGKNYGEMEAL